MSKVKSLLPVIALLIGGSFWFNIPTMAAQLTLDFETAPDGTSLDANALDSSGGQDIDGTTYSTSLGNVGDIWSSLGITITTSTDTVGLFNSNCNAGVSNDGYINSCTGGDPDLATGDGTNTTDNIIFDTDPQGNLLIIEEGTGDGDPDDRGQGGVITFDFDSSVTSVKLGSITVVDDVSAGGGITVEYVTRGSIKTNFESNLQNNDLRTYTFLDEEINSFEVDFNTASGGIGAIVFADYQQVPFEFSPGWGLLISGGGLLGIRYLKKKRALGKLTKKITTDN